jgi:hypothetical protein
MATLPNPDETQRVAPNARSSVVSYNATIDSEAMVRQGHIISTIADREIQRIDTLKAQDAETELMRAELELGEQYKSVKGGDVLKPEFHKGFKERYNDTAKQIQSTLSTPQQKARFQEIMKRRSVGFDAGRITYAMGEEERFEKDQHVARIQVLTDTAAAQYANPDVIASTAMQLEDEIVKWGKRQGMTDPNMAQAFAKETKGNFYAALIDKALTDNDTSTANSLYAASKGLLSAEQSRSFSNQLKVGNDFKEGQTLAVQAQQMVAEGKSLAEVELFVATASTPGAYTAAQTIFGNLQQASKKEQDVAFGTVTRMFHDGGSDLAAKIKVLDSPEFRKLTDAQRTAFYDYTDTDLRQDITQRRADIQFGWAAEANAEARVSRAEAKTERALNKKYKSPEAMAKFNRSFSNLKNTSVEELYALSPDIGITNVNHLVSAKKNIEAGNKPLELNKALLEAAMPPDLKKDSKEAKRDAYIGYAKAALMEWQANNPGKTPTLEQEKAIMSSANAEYTVPNRWVSGNVDKYSVMDELPSRNTGEATAKRDILRAAAAKGKTLTPAQVDVIYKRSLTQE